MNRVRNGLFVVTLVLGLLLAACAPPAAGNPPAAAGSTSNAASGQKVKIRWWHIWGGSESNIADNWQKLADAYMKDHPNVEIEITVITGDPYKDKLATNMQAGDPPDLFQTWGGGVLWQYADAGLVQDLTDALKEDSWGDSFVAGPMAVYRHNGKVYGVPWRFGMVGIWYNKALFEKAGIKETPKTWGDFLTTVKKLKDAGITPIALGEKDKWTGHFWWSYLAVRNGGQAAFAKAQDRTGSFADAPFIKAGEQLKQLIDLEPFQKGYLEQAYGDQQVVIAKEEAAMELMGQWAFGADSAVAEKNLENYVAHIDWFPFPTVEGGAGQAADAFGGGDGFAIGKNAPPETIDFVKFLTSKEHQTNMAADGIAVLPVVKGAETSVKEPVMQTVLKHFGEAEYLQLYLDQFLPPAVGLAVNDDVQELFAGTKTPEQVADAIEKVAETEMAK
ncbi:MAG: extracellular solute-binding protein [Chloroflexi bacterium]|nr:extracellular solute-binding protein [Chloroflexota bacterium]